MSRGAKVLLALACLAAAGAARGDDVEQAKARFRHAVELYKQQRFAEAADEFEAAYRTKPHGAIHFNVAQCRERLEEWPAAFRAYADYLREVPDAKDRAAVREAMRRIEGRLARTGVQVLLVYSDPPGARVTLDGVERGKAPLQLVLPPGGYALGLAMEGREPAAERVELSASASTVVELALRRAAAPLPPPQPGAEPGAGPDLSARPPPAEPARLPAAPPPARSRMLPVWIATGTAVAAAAAGLWFGASARADEQALASMSTPNGAEANQLAQSAQSKARTANVLYAVAGGAAIAAGTLYVLEARF